MASKKTKSSVYSNRRKAPASQAAPAFRAASPYHLNRKNKADGLKGLATMNNACAAAAFFDPQYRGVMDKMNYGNEGARQKGRAALRQMEEGQILEFIAELDRVLVPTGHLFLWIDKFHLCEGVAEWIRGTDLALVDLITWDKGRIGMGYRTRRKCEYLLVLQKEPRRAKGVWARHDIPDVWMEKIPRQAGHAHAKPRGLQKALIEAVTSPQDLVVDPAAGSYCVLDACREADRNFAGFDVR